MKKSTIKCLFKNKAGKCILIENEGNVVTKNIGGYKAESGYIIPIVLDCGITFEGLTYKTYKALSMDIERLEKYRTQIKLKHPDLWRECVAKFKELGG